MATGPISAVIRHLRATLVQPDGAGRSDGQLLEDYLSGRDDAALGVLVRRHGPMVWGVCRRVLRNHHDAEDAFQATFLVLVRRAESIASRELLANWLYAVAYQTALKARATAAKRNARQRHVAELPEPAVAEPVLWHDLQPLLDQELSRLPDKFRSVFILCGLQGISRKEAARQLDVPEGTVAGWFARARTLLAKRLARHGLATSAATLTVLLAQESASASVPASLVVETINAANLFAAGQAATSGAISAKVVALTEGVLRTMRMTKFTIAAAFLFAASMIALTFGALAAQHQPEPQKSAQPKPPDKQVEPGQKDLAKLQGAWHLVTAETDGLRIGEGRPENKDTRIVFEKSTITLHSKLIYNPVTRKDPEDVKSVGLFKLDTNKNPKVIVVTWETNPWNGKKDVVQQGIFALDGDTLRLCLCLPSEATQVRPTEFTANFGSKRSVLTFKRMTMPK